MKKVNSGTIFSPVRIKNRSVGVGAAALFILAAYGEQAVAESIWDLSATTSARLSYTDNVLLEAIDPNSDIVVSADGTVQAIAQTLRSQVYFSYTLGLTAYADTDGLDGISHNLTSNNRFELLPGLLNVDLTGSVRERDSSSNLRSPATVRTINNRRTRVANVVLRPNLDTDFGNWSHFHFDTSYGITDFSQPDVGISTPRDDDQIWTGNIGLNSLDKGNRLSWELGGNARGDDDDFKKYEANAALKMQISDTLRLVVRSGYDKTDGRAAGYDIEKMSWRSGFEWEPVRNAFVQFEAGERFGGPSYDGSIRYDPSSRLSLRASYVQKLDTDQGRFQFDTANSTAGTTTSTTTTTADNDIRTGTSISETYTLGVSGVIGKTNYSLTGSHILRAFDRIDPLTGLQDEDENIRGSFSLSRAFGARTNGSFNVFYQDNTTNLIGSSIEGYGGSVSASYRVGNAAQLSLRYNYQHRQDRLGNDVEENVILFSVSQRW